MPTVPFGGAALVMAGAAVGVTLFDAADAGPVPTEFVAVTVNVYGVPTVNPVTVIGETLPVAVRPPGLDDAVYVATGTPPSFAGGVNETVALPVPAVAVPTVGASGTVAVTGPPMNGPKAKGPLPTAIVATTVLVAVSITETLLLPKFAT